MLSAGAGYVLARGLVWRSRRAARLGAVAVAVVVSCVPIAIVRNDLKQYTGDAFFALSLLAIAHFADRDPRPVAVALLGISALLALPFSTTSAFVSVACFAGVLATALFAHRREHVVATLVVGGVVALGFAVVLAPIVLHANSALTNFWRAAYLTGGPLHTLGQSWTRLHKFSSGLAMPAFVFIALFVVGIVALVRMRATAVAIAVPFLWIEVFVAASLGKYPFLDQRTSHFVLIPTVAVVAIGAVWMLFELARRVPAAGVVLAALMVVLFFYGVAPWWRVFSVPYEDVRTQTEYVARSMNPTDIVVVNSSGNWGFAYYWPHDTVFASKNNGVATGFVMGVHNPNVIMAGGRGAATVTAVLRDALTRQKRAGPNSRIFIVRTHVSDSESRSVAGRVRSARRAPTNDSRRHRTRVRHRSRRLSVMRSSRHARGDRQLSDTRARFGLRFETDLLGHCDGIVVRSPGAQNPAGPAECEP